MTINADTFKAATNPVLNRSSLVLLHNMTIEARESVASVLAAAVVRADALELADALEGEPLEKAKAAAVEPEAAVAAAQKALTKERKSVIARVREFYDSAKRLVAGDDERPPEQETPAVQELAAALAAADQACFLATQPLRCHQEQIAGLRATPEPDAAVLAVLLDALKGVSS